jgi:hypothetical protein
MKAAYLILTHAYPAHLQRMISRLAHNDAHFFVHVDAKADTVPFEVACHGHHIHYVQQRVNIKWGGYSMVQATVNGFKEIVATGIPFTHVTLMSGQDYPIKIAAEIQTFLSAHQGKVFMHTLSVYNEWQEAITRLTEYHLVNQEFKGRYKVQKMLNTVLPKRHFPASMIPVGRSQWFTIPLDAVAYILDYIEQQPWIVRYFKLSWAPDEIIFHTILYNSPFKAAMTGDNLCYVDWSEGNASPKTLVLADAPQLLASPKLFARKFHPDTSKELLDLLDQNQGQ